MLRWLHARGFKSLVDLEIEFPRLTVLFGPNASGKSNIIEAAQMLSRCGTARTLSDAFAQSIRGYPLEAFSFGPDGLAGHLRQDAVTLQLEAGVDAQGDSYRYRVCVQAEPGTGDLATRDEYLAKLTKQGEPWGRPVIERVEGCLRIRRKSKPAHPREEPTGSNHTILSDLRLAGPEYAAIERCRAEFDAWRVYYLDPRVAMRAARPPVGVQDIGALGEDIAPFLHRLKADEPKRYGAVGRTLRSVIPSVDGVSVDLDERRATLDIQIMQDGRSYSSRVISEGTLRVLALCSICANPWASGLVAFEEPENGVHPRRLELIAKMLVSLALSQGRQVIVTTHSPLFCGAVLRLTRDQRNAVRLYAVRRGRQGTEVSAFPEESGTLLLDVELAAKLASPAEDGLFQEMQLRGWLDG